MKKQAVNIVGIGLIVGVVVGVLIDNVGLGISLGISEIVIKGRIHLSGEINEPTSEIRPLSKDRGVYELAQLFNRDWPKLRTNTTALVRELQTSLAKITFVGVSWPLREPFVHDL